MPLWVYYEANVNYRNIGEFFRETFFGINDWMNYLFCKRVD